MSINSADISRKARTLAVSSCRTKGVGAYPEGRLDGLARRKQNPISAMDGHTGRSSACAHVNNCSF
jgi:hypothetical protein